MFKFLQSRIDLWLVIITVVLIPVITFIVGINFRVNALEKDNVNFEDFIKEHKEQQAAENLLLTKMNTKLELVTEYFKLTPKEK